MNTARKLIETPKERLERVSESGPPYRRTAQRPLSPLALGLVLMILSILLTALVGGLAGTDIVVEYVRQLQEWASPTGR
jgi:hypothetical protein